MSKAFAVIGANFGDEGKGLVTDYLCARENATLVVRSNGGAQAGHTVVTPEGHRHVFSHFGCGTFLGVPTFLSNFVVVNPAIFAREFNEIEMLGSGARISVYADPDCLVTTPLDMLINQALEDSRGHQRHGSCGLGINETVVRSERPEFRVQVRHLPDIETYLVGIREHWVPERLRQLGLPMDTIKYNDEMHEHFLMDCDQFLGWVLPTQLKDLDTRSVVFEGAQGLLLDQNRKEFFPHLTRSNTGIKNVRILCEHAGITNLSGYYVSRTYMTRHGAGPFPTELSGLNFQDDTNVYGSYQGPLRFGALLPDQLHKRCFEDFGRGYRLVFTHCDQMEPPVDSPSESALCSFGPTRSDIIAIAEKAA